MIQRIQSLYLLISALIMGMTLLVPFMNFQTDAGIVSVTAFQIKDISSAIFIESASIKTLAIAVITTGVLSLAAIFFFKKRALQLKLIRYSIILKLALLTVIAYFTFVILKETEIKIAVIPQVGTLFLVVAMVVDWLAMKAIKKDEELVRSVDRIR